MSYLPQTLRAIRYDVVVATFVGVCALCVSAYTAHVQRQQARAMVWPILEYDTSNEPVICLTLSNKGVGPAIIRRATVKVDGQPVPDWHAALQKLLGPGEHHASTSSMVGHVLSAGETIKVLVPYTLDDKALTFPSTDPLATQMNKARYRVSVEICYSSTLGDCWTLHKDQDANGTITEISSCPAPSATDFQD